MFLFSTKLQAIDPKDGQLKTWGGPNIEAITTGEARHIINEMGAGYLELDGMIVQELDEDTGDCTEYIYWN